MRGVVQNQMHLGITDQPILPNFNPRLSFVKNNFDEATKENVCHGRGLAQSIHPTNVSPRPTTPL